METKATLFSINFIFFLTLGFASIIIFLTHKLKITKKGQLPLPPGPKGLPIIGCVPEIVKSKATFRWIFKLLEEMNTEIACIRVAGTHIIPVTSPELSREFLKKHDAVFASRPHCMSGKISGDGYQTVIFSPFGDQWKKMRRIVTSHVLSPAIHHWLHDKRCEEADHLVRYVYNKCQNPLANEPVNLRIATQHYCGNVSRKMVFGKRFFGKGMEDGGPGIEETEYVDGIMTIVDYVYGFSITDYVPLLEPFDLDGYGKILKHAMKNVRKNQDPEIDKRVEMWEQGVRSTQEDILDVMINLKDSTNIPLLSIEEIKAQIAEIMLASIDNPSNAAEWAIAEMINQPEIFKKAHEELDREVGRDRLVMESDMCKLNYIKACAKEAFRLHPIAPFNVPHVSTEDTVVGGYFIPKGSHVILSRPGLGRNPSVWEEPLKYKPERHINNESSEVVLFDHDFHTFSFSSGRRGCPGIALGSTITTMLFARLLQGFNWSAPPHEPVIDMAEAECNMLKAKPLIARAEPRLKKDLYLQLLMKN